MNSIFIVTTSKGSWDGWSPITVGIYTSMWEAEKGREEWIQRIKAWENKYTEEEQQQLAEEWKAVPDNTSYDESPEHLKLYDKWINDQYEYEKYNEQVDIEEIELNKIIYIIE